MHLKYAQRLMKKMLKVTSLIVVLFSVLMFGFCFKFFSYTVESNDKTAVKVDQVETVSADSSVQAGSGIAILLPAEQTTENVEVVSTDDGAYEVYYDSSNSSYYTGYTTAYRYNSNLSETGQTFMRDGVVYNEDGSVRYTYYSSNVAYHYQTSQWTANADGMYTTSDGYIVVASSDYDLGTIVETPWGQGQVLDTGCSSGTIDIYTNY